MLTVDGHLLYVHCHYVPYLWLVAVDMYLVLTCSAQFNPAVLVGHCSVFVFISAYL